MLNFNALSNVCFEAYPRIRVKSEIRSKSSGSPPGSGKKTTLFFGFPKGELVLLVLELEYISLKKSAGSTLGFSLSLTFSLTLLVFLFPLQQQTKVNFGKHCRKYVPR